MSEEHNKLITDISAFTVDSMDWCIAESEKSAKEVGEILDFLIQDAERIASVSKDTLQKIKSIKTMVDKVADSEKTMKLILSLVKLCKENAEIKDLVYPIVEALQFQDRICQNMQNVEKMLDVWIGSRSKFAKTSELSEEDKITFGKSLLECTTMNEERELIRQMFPNLPEEDNAVDDVLLF